MEMKICKLTKELLADWLSFFDNDAFTDNDAWCGCYCMCYHWNQKLNKRRPWNCDERCAKYNRKQATKFIKKGYMQGYLAYADGKVVGWCNANDKTAYDNVNFNFAKTVPDNGEKIKSIVCFSIAPEYRGRNVASELLEYVCEDAKFNGYDFVEAYPFAKNEHHAYHGPVSMYKKNGFVACNKIEGCVIYRKYL